MIKRVGVWHISFKTKKKSIFLEHILSEVLSAEFALKYFRLSTEVLLTKSYVCPERIRSDCSSGQTDLSLCG